MTHQPRCCRGAGIVPPIVLAAVWVLAFTTDAVSGSYGFPYQTCRVWPAVPTQRAMIIHRDGVEQLVLEAAAPGEGSFGWIVPVPTRPTSVQEASPGLLKTIAIETQPELTGDVRLTAVKWLAGLVTAWGVLLLVARPETRGGAFVRLVVVLLVGGAVPIEMMRIKEGPPARPSWPRIPQHATDAAGLCVTATQPAGLAGPVVVQPESIEAFDRWLEEHGFSPVPEAARKDVSAYIERRWHFVVRRVQAEEDGLCSPPAVSIEFAVGEPVYPPRLGQPAGSQAAMELVVLADRQAAAEGLTAEFAGRFEQVETPGTLGQLVRMCSQVGSYADRGRVRYSQVSKAIWPECQLTRLYGAVAAGEAIIRLGPSRPHRLHAYTQDGALLTAWAWGWVTWSVALPVGVLALGWRAGRRGPWLARLGVVLPLATSLTVFVGTYVLLPRMEAELRRVFYGDPESVHRELLEEVQARCGPMGKMSLDEVRAILADHFRYKIAANGATTGSILEEESPDNYTLQEMGVNELMLRWHDRWRTRDVLIHRGPDGRLVLDQPPREDPLQSKPPTVFGGVTAPISDPQTLAIVRDCGRPLWDLPSEIGGSIERLARQTRTAMPADRGDRLQVREFLDRIERRLRAQDR